MPAQYTFRRSAALAALLAASVSPAALAQDVSSAQPEASDRLEAIVVTGEKRDRTLMDTASSVSVTTAEEMLRRAGLETTGDLLAGIANLVSTEPGNLAPAVRGIDGTGPAEGADAFFAGTRPRLNYQVDGRTLTYNEAIFSDATLWDVEHVEVFRGPQSTLQGRNAVAGAIVLKTKDPTYEWEGTARLLAGNRSTWQGSAALSGPIVEDQVAFRLSADQRMSSSFVNFPAYEGVDKPEEYKSLALRGKLLLEPDALPDLRALLTVSYMDAHAPQTAEVARPFKQHQPSYPPQPVFGTEATSGILDTTWDISDTLSLQTLLSASDINVTRRALPGDGNATINITEYVAEPRLNMSLLDQRLEGFVGVHVFRSSQDEYIDMFGGGTFDDSTDTDAVFGEATMHVTDRVDVTVGGRYEREERDRDGGVGPFVISFHETYKEFLPKTSVAVQVTDDLRTGLVIGKGYNAGGAGFTYEVPFLSYTFEPERVWNYEWFWRASLMQQRLSFNGNVFYNDYRNLQLPFDLNPDPDLWSYVVRNADKAKTYGLELNGRFLVLDGLEVFANGGLLKTDVSRYPGSGIEGNELPRSPSFTASFGFSYARENGLDLSADARYSDSYYSEVMNEARGKTDPYWVVNAKIGYTVDYIRIFASVTNIFDSAEPIRLSPGATPADDIATILQPRSYTAGVQFSF